MKNARGRARCFGFAYKRQEGRPSDLLTGDCRENFHNPAGRQNRWKSRHRAAGFVPRMKCLKRPKANRHVPPGRQHQWKLRSNRLGAKFFDFDRKRGLFSQCGRMIGGGAAMTLGDISVNQHHRPQCAVLRLFAETASEAGFPYSGGRFSGEGSCAGFKARRTICDRAPMPRGTSE